MKAAKKDPKPTILRSFTGRRTLALRVGLGSSFPRVSDKELAAHLREAWKLSAPEKLHDGFQ